MEKAPRKTKEKLTQNLCAERWISAFLVLLLLLMSMDAFLGTDTPLRWGAVIFLAAVLFRRSWELAPCALFFFYFYVGSQWFPGLIWRLPVAPLLLPLALTWVTCRLFPELRDGFSWLRRGELDQVTLFMVILVSLISALALVLWALWTDYLGVATAMITSFRRAPLWLMLVVGIPVFALSNAFAEEAIFRGVIQDSLEKRFRERTWLVLGVQASAFAALHYRAGFPNGKLGYVMTLVYATMLGWLRRRSRGMLAPYLAHVAADAVIGITLLLLAG